MKYNFIKKLEALLISSAVIVTTGISPATAWASEDDLVQIEQEADDFSEDCIVSEEAAVQNISDSDNIEADFSDDLSASEETDLEDAGESIDLKALDTELSKVLSRSKTPLLIKYSKPANVIDYIQKNLSTYITDMDVSNVKLAYLSSTFAEYFDSEANIIDWPRYEEKRRAGIKLQYECNGVTYAGTKTCYFWIGPDVDFWNEEIKNIRDNLTFDNIKGSSTDTTENVTAALSLPSKSGYNFVKISWSTDRPDILQINDSTGDSCTAVLNRKDQDQKITLTATFQYMYDDEYPEIQECTKSFELTVKKIARAVIRSVDTSGASIDHAVTVLKDHAGNTVTSTDGKTFDVSEDEEYTYEISAEGYGTVKGTFTAGQGTTEIPVTLKSNEEINQENQQRLDAVATAVDARLTDPSQTLLDSSSGTSITAYIQSHLPDYTDAETEISLSP